MKLIVSTYKKKVLNFGEPSTHDLKGVVMNRIDNLQDNVNSEFSSCSKLDKDYIKSQWTKDDLARLFESAGYAVKRDGGSLRVSGTNRALCIIGDSSGAYVIDHRTEEGKDIFQCIEDLKGIHSFPEQVKFAAEFIGLSVDQNEFSGSGRITKRISELDSTSVLYSDAEDEMEKAIKERDVQVIKERHFKSWTEDVVCSPIVKNILALRGIPFDSIRLFSEFIGFCGSDYISYGNSDKDRHVFKSFVFWSCNYKAVKFMQFNEQTGHRLDDGRGIISCGTSFLFSPLGSIEKDDVVIAVESEMDALALALRVKQKGIENCKPFASSSQQIPACKTALLCYDNDSPGDNKTSKANDYCIKNGIQFFDIRTSVVNDKKDILNDPGDLILNGFDRLDRILAHIPVTSFSTCTYSKRSFTHNDEIFRIDKQFFDSCCNNELIPYLKKVYNIIGLCNGRFVIKKGCELYSPTVNDLLDQTKFTDDGRDKRIPEQKEAALIKNLYKFYDSQEESEGDLPYIPIMPKIPFFADIQKSQQWRDKIFEVYNDFINQAGRSSLKDFMRVLGYILTGDFWKTKDKRFFVNIVSKDKGIGKSNLFCWIMLKDIKVCWEKVQVGEEITRFSFSQYANHDILVFDDIPDEKIPEVQPLLSRIISNATGLSEPKAKDARTVRNLKSLIIATSNLEIRLADKKDTTGLTSDKKILLRFDNTNKEVKTKQYFEKHCSALVNEAINNPGIQMEFLKDCIEEYKKNPDFGDLYCSKTQAQEKSEFYNLFSVFDVNCDTLFNKSNQINLANTYTKLLNDNKNNALGEFYEKGVLRPDKIASKFFAILKCLQTDLLRKVNPIDASLSKQEVSGVKWISKCRGKDEHKNCFISSEGWKVLTDLINKAKESMCLNDEDGESENKQENHNNYKDVETKYNIKFYPVQNYENDDF